GPKIADLIARVTGREDAEDCRVVDLLFHAPYSLIDRRNRPGIALAPQGAIVTIEGRVDRHQPPPARTNQPYRVFLHDETGELALTFFRAKGDWLHKTLPVDEQVMVSGKVDWFNGRASMIHPDFMVKVSEAENLPLVEPVYPMTAGLSSKTFRRTIEAAIARLPQFPEWADLSLTQREGFPTVTEAFQELHDPRDETDIDPQSKARRRLAYDEFLAGQVSLALVRQKIRKVPGQPIRVKGELAARLVAALPFSLTPSQKSSVDDIIKDMAGEDRMLRLLQGDVGAGKTLVALLAMAAAVEAGGQAVLMAPTEILARQHFSTISKLAGAAGVTVELLTGRTKGREREAIVERIASGEAQIVIGTHALFQDTVSYHSLMLAVVDEQHRFGVHQRLRLTAKGISPHM
ncbi:MAG: DEAD/DEAH box helicase, partial [Rhizobiaceae bacterium]